ncbi:hypothetical protein RSAG8_05861, partial [Rhizoctonia solani AG-8 WAC10335]
MEMLGARQSTPENHGFSAVFNYSAARATRTHIWTRVLKAARFVGVPILVRHPKRSRWQEARSCDPLASLSGGRGFEPRDRACGDDSCACHIHQSRCLCNGRS